MSCVVVSASAAAKKNNGFLQMLETQKNNHPKQQQPEHYFIIREGRGRGRRGFGFNNRGLVILFFGLSGFLPISQWMRLSTTTTNHLSSLYDYFNINSTTDRSSSTLTTSDSMAEIAMLHGLSTYQAAINNNTSTSNVGSSRKEREANHTTKADSSGAAGTATKEGLLRSIMSEMCPTTTDTTTTMLEEEHIMVHAVTEADEGGFFIRTSYPKTYPIEDIMEEGNKRKQLMTTISSSAAASATAFQNNNDTKVQQQRIVVHVVAYCEFRHNLPNSNHFPHTMQQLYRCWSWWQYVIRKQQQQHSEQWSQAAVAAAASANNSTTSAAATIPILLALQPVLVLKRDRVVQRQSSRQQQPNRRAASSMLENNRFVHGFLDALKTSINLTIVYNDDEELLPKTTSSDDVFAIITAKPKLESNRDLYDYRMHSIHDGPNLRTAVLQTLTNSSTRVAADDANDKNVLLATAAAAATTEQSFCNPNGSTFPRITILNRRKNRRILNVQEMQHAIYLALGGGGGSNRLNNSTTTTTQPPPPLVRVEYFEGRSFAEQVSVLANTDLLISPHGAQLTGLPFLPTPCSAVLEIFPRGYWIPKFFGSLAATTGLHQHACLYLGARDHDHHHHGGTVNRTHQVHEATKTVRDRFRTRSQNMCFPVNRTLQAIQQMIHSWRQCCDMVVAHQKEESTTTWP